jgi:hypothetical protein
MLTCRTLARNLRRVYFRRRPQQEKDMVSTGLIIWAVMARGQDSPAPYGGHLAYHLPVGRVVGVKVGGRVGVCVGPWVGSWVGSWVGGCEGHMLGGWVGL